MSIGKIIQSASMPQIGQIKSASDKIQNKKADGVSGAIGEFSDLLSSGIKKTDSAIKEYQQLSDKFARGESVNIHEVMIKGEQADVTLRVMSAIRSKVIEAYGEIMRMPV